VWAGEDVPTTFRFDRSCVARLASQRLMQGAVKDAAERFAAAARSADPAGNYHAAPVVTDLADLRRAGYRVQDTTPDATTREFGRGRRPGRRTLGRLSS
jgi:hypothetical protein